MSDKDQSRALFFEVTRYWKARNMPQKNPQLDGGRPAREPSSAFQRHVDILAGLKEYCHFARGQGFAVLLNGPWGCGKTQFIKRNLEALKRERSGETAKAPIYISLYGVSNIGMIEDRIYEQVHPVLSHKVTRIVGAVLRGAAKSALKFDVGSGMSISGGAGEIDFSTLISGAEGRVVVFDDLERAIISPVEILGYLNPLVEHEDCKVIIIVDEKNIQEGIKEEYRLRKEKTIGRTFEFEADAEGLYDDFLSEIDDEDARHFMESKREIIVRIFRDSESNNLRILKYFMWDFEKIWKILTQEQRGCSDAMNELLGIFCASSMELRKGKLQSEEFVAGTTSSRVARLMRTKTGDATRSEMEIVEERYPTVRFDSTLLARELIVDIVLRSKVEAAKIRGGFDSHPYLRKLDSDGIPSWRKLWLAFELSPDEQASVVGQFEADFDARLFAGRVEIYHVIGLGIYLSRLGFANWSTDEVEDKINNYIQDIFKNREPTSTDVADTRSLDLDFTNGTGLAYREAESEIFKRLVDYERQAREGWRKNGYPIVAGELMKLAHENSDEFLRQVSHTAGGPATYANVPVLGSISAEEFAKIIVAAKFHDQSKLTMALSIRYKHGVGLEAEAPWLCEVRKHLDQLAAALPPIAKDTLLNLIRLYLDQFTEKLAST